MRQATALTDPSWPIGIRHTELTRVPKRHSRWMAVSLGVLTLTCVAPVSDTHEVNVGTWSVKIDKRLVRLSMGRTLFVLKSRAPGENRWRKIATFSSAHPNGIRRDNLEILEPSSATFFLGSTLAVTTDAGRSWSTWNTSKDMQPPCQYRARIDAVSLLTGEMTVQCHADPLRYRLYASSDAGRTWRFVKYDEGSHIQ